MAIHDVRWSDDPRILAVVSLLTTLVEMEGGNNAVTLVLAT